MRPASLKRLAILGALSLGMAACGGGTPTNTATSPTPGGESATETAANTGGSGSTLSGNVLVDGSSTVFPISEAMAEEFMKANPGVRVTVGVSGTGGGFKKFCAGETDISNASRPIKKEEIELCEKNGIEFVEVPIAFDGLSVVVNKANDFATCLTVAELKTIWEPAAEGKIKNWNQVRDGFPDKPLGLYGAGTDSGTYDYFMEAIVGKDESRGDFTASEDDNTIVQGVEADEGGLGFFGYAYYAENKDRLKLVEIDGGNGCVAPNETTIADGTYIPLSRPEFFYVKTTSLKENPAVAAFANFLADPANQGLISEVGYVPIPAEFVPKAQARLANAITGSVFEGGSAVGVKLADKL
ncbi:PstS family phosphate ABC transporter substrate-binding protein [Trichothermofontia sp.]